MSFKADAFLESLRATFKVEAAEHSQSIATGLLELEKAPPPDLQRDLVATVFRAAHSLKGAARAVDLIAVESSCQLLEDLFSTWKRGEVDPTRESLDTAHQSLDAITAVLYEQGASPGVPSPAVVAGAEAEPEAKAEAQPSSTTGQRMGAPVASVADHRAAASEDTVRITVAKLDARLMEAEEMLTAKLTTGQRVEDLRDLGRRFEVWQGEWSIIEPVVNQLAQSTPGPATASVAAPAAAALARLLAFFDWNRDHLRLLESNVAALTRTAQQDHHTVGKLVDDLLEDSKKLLLLPFATLSVGFSKLVRDLARDLGKEVDLVIVGEQIEIDKRVLEEIKDSLVHLLRNCIDHGVEKPAQRLRAGKPARATITLVVSQVDGSKVQILVTDDGAGIDMGKVKAAAIKQGVLSAREADQRDDAEVRDLIFRSELSTSPMITRLSGRGLGMTIVREQAEKLGGTVAVSSQSGTGTQFRIVLPSMLATFRGVLIDVAGQLFVVPTAHVERVERIRTDSVQTAEGRETVALSGRAVSLVRLADVLGLPLATAEPAIHWTVVVLGLGDQRIAFVVDAVLGEQEVLVKRLRRPLSRIRNISGATVLGSGRVAPILNIADLLKSARKAGIAAVRAPKAATAPASAKSVLAVDDSATSRMLIKNMLESAGYKVTTAVDGIEAFTLLRAEKFDILVSDVEMPRLGGFDLTARIRADARLSELPVVLVTALETREDRERGIDVGANAYIVKSSLDQSNLIGAVRRLA
ncbi:hybrid sensor histidine kinase/response regulator [soil metagenome]